MATDLHILQVTLAICAVNDFNHHRLTLANLPRIMLFASGYASGLDQTCQ